TPSLDEMVHVAKEMERQHFTVPLLIGGATTSAKHTAVKIAPAYSRSTVHVLDASRSVGVVEKLLNPKSKDEFDRQNRDEQGRLADAYHERQSVHLVSYAQAAAARFPTDWSAVQIDVPSFIGTRLLDDFPLDELLPYIDWSPFFAAWELRGKYPKIFNDPDVGAEAR